MDKPATFTFWLLTLLAPITGVIITVVLLILINFITDYYVKRKPIENKQIRNTVSKLFIYSLVIISAYFLEKNIVSEVPFLKVAAGFIVIAEIKSILENYNKIYGVNPFKTLINLLKQIGSKNKIEQTSDDKNLKK